MTGAAAQPTLQPAAERQFRMRRLQLFNWGTFSGLHEIPVAPEGFLLIGRSGSGKSTLLDALSALLVPPLLLSFNAAAREGDRSNRDRNLVSYVRGAWADQKDLESGEIATQYLRPGTTWSALAVEYADGAGNTVSLAQLFWLRGSASRTADVHRHYMVARRPFDIGVDLAGFERDLDLRRLKQRLQETTHNESFRPYANTFMRLLGIESEMALKLLHKTQSAKNLGDLNSFLREFMLDRPQTFDVAERLVKEFAELDEAHKAVVTARRQVETLRPAREALARVQAIDSEQIEVTRLLGAVDGYRDERKAELLLAQLNGLTLEQEALAGQERRARELVANHKSELRALELRHRDEGGAQIELLEQERTRREIEREDLGKRRDQAHAACRALGWQLADHSKGYAELLGRARELVEGWRERSEQVEEKRFTLRSQKGELERQFADLRREIEAMERQPSKIPSHMLALRRRMATELGLDETELPFVGELIDVKEEEGRWRGAIERVLHGFALALLVEERHYPALSTYVNDSRLGGRLVYYRVQREAEPLPQPKPRSLVHKLLLKPSPLVGWLDGELRRRFDYACVENLRDFRQEERAVTCEGQVRHSRTRHEKDDRRAIDDAGEWVLGFDNRDKLALFRKRAHALAGELARVDAEIRTLGDERGRQEERYRAALTLANFAWRDIDVAAVLDALRKLEGQIDALRSGNELLEALGLEIKAQLRKLDAAERALSDTSARLSAVINSVKQAREEWAQASELAEAAALPEALRAPLAGRFEAEGPLTLKNLEAQRTRVERELNARQRKLLEERNALVRLIEECFASYLRNWQIEGAEVRPLLEWAQEFMALLLRLEHDGLPRHEQRFFDMLKEQSTENLAALNTHLIQARKEITERMELVNLSLAEAQFNPGTFLRIEVSERHLPDVREFRERVRRVLENAFIADPEQAEERFRLLRELVMRLGGEESEHQRWREQVLDVRQHVEFVGRELAGSGDELREVEVYRSGAGKSGGQREKLATTCLAAALRYQLGGAEGGPPSYAPVVLDEAFAKADNEFTELAMKVFAHFGFQMIVATPLKSVMTLEPFIGGACFVEIHDRRHSRLLIIEYDRGERRLRLAGDADGPGAAA